MDRIKESPDAGTLKFLSRSEFGSIRMGVAGHPNTDTRTLIDMMHKDKNYILIIRLAERNLVARQRN